MKSPVIPPYDTRTKFIDDEKGKVSDPHEKWLQQVGVKLNSSLQIVSVPVSLTSDGVPGQMAFDATGFFVCIAPNVWKKAAFL